MPNYICVTCGTQYPETAAPPLHCLICEDERQYVNPDGQQWTTMDALQANHKNTIRAHELNLVGIGTEPRFGIGQRALLIQRPEGNILWDCFTLLDASTIESVTKLGGIS